MHITDVEQLERRCSIREEPLMQNALELEDTHIHCGAAAEAPPPNAPHIFALS
jgi:hypothetical protein